MRRQPLGIPIDGGDGHAEALAGDRGAALHGKQRSVLRPGRPIAGPTRAAMAASPLDERVSRRPGERDCRRRKHACLCSPGFSGCDEPRTDCVTSANE